MQEFVSAGQEEYHSVEITLDDLTPLYQFKLRKTESCPMFFVVRQDSQLLERLQIGNVFQMKFYGHDMSCSASTLDTRIDRIFGDPQGRFKGHCVIELSIIGKNITNSVH